MNKNRGQSCGCVREKLILAGIKLLAEHDSEGLTLRRIAALVGVSHAAPAHYFNGLPGLRSAIAERGFQMLSRTLSDTQLVTVTSDFDRLEAAADAYIKFSEENSALFRLMFDELITPTPELSKTAIESYDVLKSVCSPFTSSEKGDQFEIMAWSVMHGYTSLQMNRPRAPTAPFIVPSLSSMLRMLIRANAVA